jgi:hypothetical protein
MKNSVSIAQRQMDGFAPLPAAGNLSHLDGHCFIGEGGLLGVALTKKGLQQLRRNGSPTHWLIPLDQSGLAEEAAALPGEVLWLSPQPPADLLGLLNVDVQGVWKEGDAVAINACNRALKLRLPEIPLLSLTAPYLARVFVDFWMGCEASGAGTYSKKLTQPQPALEVAA